MRRPLSGRLHKGLNVSLGMKRFVANTGFSSVAGFGVAGASFISSVIVARLLGAEGAGVVTFALWLATFIAAICDLGITASLARFIPEFANDPKRGDSLAARLLRPYAALTLGAGGVLVLLAFAAPSWLSPSGHAETAKLEWVAIAAIVVSASFSGFQLAWLRGQQRFHVVALLTLVSVAM